VKPETEYVEFSSAARVLSFSGHFGVNILTVSTVKRSFILKNIKRLRYHFVVLGGLWLLASGAAEVSIAATLTASTSLTVVNVTEFLANSNDITQWGGAWPQPPVAPKTPADIVGPVDQELYIRKVDFYPHTMEWFTTPYPTPYRPFPNGVTSLVCAVWSMDGGKTFKLQSWDYLVSTTKVKSLEAGMPNCWMGTIVHAICDRKAGECNGRNRSNLIFEEYPSGSTGCWGSSVMN